MQELHIRPVNEHDAEDIARLDQLLTGFWRIEHWEERIAFAARRDPEGSLVAQQGQRVVAYLFSDVRGVEYGFSRPTGWLEAIGVAPEAQGTSIGRGLVERMLQRFRQTGVDQVRTLVSSQHSQMGEFLGHLGFQEEPIRVLCCSTSEAKERSA